MAIAMTSSEDFPRSDGTKQQISEARHSFVSEDDQLFKSKILKHWFLYFTFYKYCILFLRKKECQHETSQIWQKEEGSAKKSITKFGSNKVKQSCHREYDIVSANGGFYYLWLHSRN